MEININCENCFGEADHALCYACAGTDVRNGFFSIEDDEREVLFDLLMSQSTDVRISLSGFIQDLRNSFQTPQ